MTEAKPVQQTADIRAVDRHPTTLQCNTQLVEGHVAILLNLDADEVVMRGKLAPTHPMALPARLNRTRLGPQLHQIIHKARRNPEMPRRLTVAVAFIHKRYDAHPKLHRKWLAHRGSPSTTMNHQTSNSGIPNPLNRDTL
jgi:hypothetical protein